MDLAKTIAACAACLAAANLYAADPFRPVSAPAAPAKVEVKVPRGNNMPLVKGVLNGKPCTLLFDTGATHTTFDLAFVKENLPEAKLQPVMLAGETNVAGAPSLFKADALRLGDAEFGDFSAMCLDMSHLHSSIGERVDGVLGMNVIGRTRTLVSLGGGEVVFGLTEAAREGFDSPVRRVGFDPFTGRTPDPHTIAIEAETGGAPRELIVDSGSTWTFLDQPFGWPATTNRAAISATDINGRGGFAPVVGEPGTLKLLPGAGLEIRPLIVEEPLNRIGSDVLLRYDMLVEPRAVAFRIRQYAPPRGDSPEGAAPQGAQPPPAQAKEEQPRRAAAASQE